MRQRTRQFSPVVRERESRALILSSSSFSSSFSFSSLSLSLRVAETALLHKQALKALRCVRCRNVGMSVQLLAAWPDSLRL